MNGHWCHWQNDALLLKIHLHPGAKINEVSGLLDMRLRIRIKSPPVDGKANKELITMLARDFGTKKTQIRIVGGKLGHDKLVEVRLPVTFPQWFIDLNCKENSG
jgi:uncharacterized protein